jgi:tubby-related protein 1
MESRRRFDDDEDEDDGKYDRRGGDKWGGGSSSNRNSKSNSREERRRDKGSRNKQSEWEGGAKLDDDRVGARFRNSENIRETVRTIEPLNLSDMRQFLTNPVPKGCGVVQCYIRRNKNGTNKIFPVYSLYLKEGDRFLMTSKKRPNNKTSNYLISMGEGDMNRDGVNYLGKLRSNFVGTEFQVFDNGISPKEAGMDDSSSSIRKELGSVIYAANVLGSRGPRKMQVAIPAVDENNQITTWRQGSTNDQEDILGRIRDRNLRDLVYLINKPPRWNEQVGAYVLNFNGRVTMASVKNFQLVDPDEQNTVVLQFGRVGKDDFTMDLQWPMSPLQAFAITLSSFDSKIACD